jgi:hypothetical protein
MRLAFLVVLGLVCACGDDGWEPPLELADRLAALPGVHSVEEKPTQAPGFRYFVLRFEQPVDHADPRGPTFLQKVSLLHRDETAPMVEYTSGYWDYYNDFRVELTVLLGANQASIEHRYFAESRPEQADWSQLTIEQMAHDQHRITTALRMVYSGAFITAGASKGGMTATYYRRFYPDDVDGTVPYVAPISFGAPDTRYVSFLDTLGPSTCRQAIRAVATELLANRRAMVEQRVTDQAAARGYVYTRIAPGPAVESSVFNLEWSFWQYYGVDDCNRVPPATASDDDLWEFLDDVSPVSDNADTRIAQFDAYYHQAYHQLGYPDGGADYLDPHLLYGDADYAGALPAEMPAYDGGAAMADIDSYVRNEGDRFAFIYGEWDPWTGGRYELGNATDSLSVVQAQGTHAARITALAPADRQAVFDKLEAWTGVTPKVPGSAVRNADGTQTVESALGLDVRPPRVPPAIRRMLSRPR